MKTNDIKKNNSSLLAKWKNKTRDSKPINNGLDNIKEIPIGISRPLSHEQKRLWFLQQLHPNNPFYNYSELYTLEGNFNAKLFKQSIRLIEEKHDVFKSIFVIKDGVPTVKINPENATEFNYYDYSDLDLSNANQEAQKIFLKYARTSFNLSEGNLSKAVLIKVSERKYLFLVVIHHIIIDHWSMTIFRKELAANYAALVSGKNTSIDKPNIQYDSYAYWQQNRALNVKHLDYWKEKLRGKPGALNLPFDFPKKTIPTYKGALHKKLHDQENSTAFFKLCKELEATPYVVMLSVFYVLLHKYSRQEDILIGTSITKRNQEALEKIIGFFNDTLVFRTTINKHSPFKEIVTAVKKTTLEAFANSDVSYDSLVKELKPERTLNTNPYFQVMFLYNVNKNISDFGSDIKITHEPFDAGVAKFDLTLHVFENQGTLTSILDYETDLFEAKTIERIHDHFEVLLKAFVANPEKLISNVVLETKQETAFFEKLQHPTIAIENQFNSIHTIIEQQIVNKPLSPAVSFKDQTLSYKELGDQSDKIASYLIQKGVQKNDIIGLSLNRSTQMISALLGILKAGAAYLPLDPKYPKSRTQYILEHSCAKLVLTSTDLQANFESFEIKHFALQTILSKNLEINSSTFPEVQANDLAYVIYTSGSTGKPKGVPITHLNIINSTLARTEFYASNPTSFLLLSSISFDSSKAGVFWSLCTGANLVISEDKLEQDIDRLVQIIKNKKVSHTLMLPSLYQMVLNFGNSSDLKTLKVVTVAGEACSKKIATKHFETLTNTHLYNEYGPTEGTVWCIAHKVEKTDLKKESIPIGLPVANTKIYILDENLKRVPFGSPGELYIGGRSLSNGYLNSPEKTAENFITSPFDNDQKIYKTGDLVCFKNDNTIVFLGRIDQQIKIRGYRIEIEEIEEVIKNIIDSQQVIVIAESTVKKNTTSKLEKQSTEELIKTIHDLFLSTEVENLLNSIESLNSEEASILSNNL